MKPLLPALVWVGMVQALSVLAQEAAPVRPPPPTPQVVTASSQWQAADALLASGQAAKAIDAFRAGLRQFPDHPDVRLRLAKLLIEQHRASEAMPELRTLLRQRPDAATFGILLSALRTAGSPIELAMTAQEAVAAFPANTALLLAAVDALKNVKAFDVALQYWGKLTVAEQQSARGQGLLGELLEATGQPALAFAAYTVAARTEPKAQAALERLSARSLALAKGRYFAPTGWRVTNSRTGELTNAQHGMRAQVRLINSTQTSQTIAQAIQKSVPLPADELGRLIASAQTVGTESGLTSTSAQPPQPFTLQKLKCDAPAGLLCLELAPGKAVPGLFATLHIGSALVNGAALTVVIEGASRETATAALAELINTTLIVPGAKP